MILMRMRAITRMKMLGAGSVIALYGFASSCGRENPPIAEPIITQAQLERLRAQENRERARTSLAIELQEHIGETSAREACALWKRGDRSRVEMILERHGSREAFLHLVQLLGDEGGTEARELLSSAREREIRSEWRDRRLISALDETLATMR